MPPRTPAAKVAVRKNAVRHGLTGEVVLCLSEEEEVAFAALREEVAAHVQPANGLERVLADRITSLLWRLRRCAAVEAATFAAAYRSGRREAGDTCYGYPREQEPELWPSPGAETWGRLQLVARYERTLWNLTREALRELQRLREPAGIVSQSVLLALPDAAGGVLDAADGG